MHTESAWNSEIPAFAGMTEYVRFGIVTQSGRRVSSNILKRLDSRFHGNDTNRLNNTFSSAC
ncbi:MAG: hypothetical protein C4581_01630 [Nitrospiraceae bacterium]|nr:MAG: hypothetical protein C4581_01630 [Nitrospiraceae bacterium]